MRPIYLFSISSYPDVVNVKSLCVKFLKPKIDFSKYDYLIISSKQASLSLKQYETQDYIDKKALCISHKSSISYKKLGAKILDIGDGYGDSLIEKIKLEDKHRRWLYLRAKVVSSNFVEICKNDGYNIEEKIIYETSCSEEILSKNIEENATLIFTSPSSIKCFLKTHSFTKNNKIIVIGKTTAKILPKDIDFMISNSSDIQTCVYEAIKISK